MSLDVYQTNSFKKDLKRIGKQGKNLKYLFNVIETLVEEKPLPFHLKNHKLTGNWGQHYECHIKPDWLLIYKIDNRILILERTGSHSELF